MEYGIEKPSNKLLALAELDSDTCVGEMNRIRGKKLSVTAFHAPRSDARTPARARAAETLILERGLSHLVNLAWHDPPARGSPPGASGPFTYEPCEDVDLTPDYEGVLTD